MRDVQLLGRIVKSAAATPSRFARLVLAKPIVELPAAWGESLVATATAPSDVGAGLGAALVTLPVSSHGEEVLFGAVENVGGRFSW